MTLLVRTKSRSPRTRSARAAFSLVEVAISTAIVASLMVGALKTQDALTRARVTSGDRSQAWLLGQDLMTEILTTYYVEPTETPVFGPETTEGGGNRSKFDDVDDYNNWTASPPQNKDGTTISNRSSFRQTVVVEYVSPSNPSTTVGTDQGAKRITVTISKNSVTLATLVAIRTSAWQLPPYDVSGS